MFGIFVHGNAIDVFVSLAIDRSSCLADSSEKYPDLQQGTIVLLQGREIGMTDWRSHKGYTKLVVLK